MNEEVKVNASKVAGGAAGVGIGVGSLAAAGSVSGLSAAGITSGLAALGLGSMLAGVFIVGGITAVAGYGTYKLIKKALD